MGIYRYKIEIEYDGTGLSGWQAQDGPLTVQQILEDSIKIIYKKNVDVCGAGRTDAGVHAFGQIAHFDLEDFYDPYRLKFSLNHFLRSHNIIIKDCKIVDSSFHARFSAISRSYIYKIINRPEPLAILRNQAWNVREHLNEELMNKAACMLIGTHDLASFRSRHCQAKTSIKTITYLKVFRDQELIETHITAPSFLHNQVRIIMGCLADVGRKKITLKDFASIISAKNRNKASPTAPANGLYLAKVEY